MQTIHQKPSSNQGGKKQKKADSGYQKLVDIAKSRNTPMEIVLCHDVSSNQYLFDDNGFMKKAQKSILVNEVEKTLTETDKHLPNFCDANDKTGVIIDTMATIRKLKLKGLKTFGDLCHSIKTCVERSYPTVSRIDYVFDSYDLVEDKEA